MAANVAQDNDHERHVQVRQEIVEGAKDKVGCRGVDVMLEIGIRVGIQVCHDQKDKEPETPVADKKHDHDLKGNGKLGNGGCRRTPPRQLKAGNDLCSAD